MSGYNGYSMSNNAVVAYACGEKPLSKWKKSDILFAIKSAIDNGSLILKCNIDKLSKLQLSILKSFLVFSSWHHTSSRYNKTDFYSVDFERIEELTDNDINDLLKKYKSENVHNKEISYCYAYAEVQIWSNSRSYSKIIGLDRVAGIVIGRWLYYKPNHNSDCCTRKYNVYANKTVLYEEFNSYQELVDKHSEFRCTKKVFEKIIKERLKTNVR